MSIYYADYFTYGTISGAGELLGLVDTALTTAGWVRYYTVSTLPTSFDVTYKSTGEDGVSALYTRVTRETGESIGLRAYSYFDSGTGTGYNEAGDKTAETNIDIGTLEPLAFTCRCDKDEFVCYWVDIFDYSSQGWVWFGQLDRQLPSEMSGKTFTTANMNGGSNVSIAVADDLRGKLRPGQTIHIINQDTNAGVGDAKEVTVLSGVTATHITFKTVSTTYDSGALVGLNPMPAFVANGGAGQYTTPTCYFIFDASLARSGPVAQSIVPRPMVRPDQADLILQGLDTYYVYPIQFVSLETVLGSSRGVQANSGLSNLGSLYRVLVGNGGADDRYIIPFGFPTYGPAPDAGFKVLFGPGIPA